MSLDRTNVVQQLMGRFVLFSWCSMNQLVDDRMPAELDSLFRTLWIENADLLSQRYTGSAAMKTDPSFRGKM